MAASFCIAPVSGLGNRMRVVASAVKFCSLHDDVHVRIVWQPAWDCRAQFDDLFQPFTLPNVKVTAGTFIDTPATKRNLLLPMWLRKSRYAKEYRCYHPGKMPSLEALSRTFSSVYLDTCYALTPYEPADMQRCFTPQPQIADAIRQTTERFTPTTVGVHIRRTDNIEAIRHSPLSAFRCRLDALVDAGKADSIFLCTDDEHIKTYFRETYGRRLLTRRATLRRDSLDGMRDAVIDLWCLSRTARILGSYYSSFSDTAAELSDTPFEIIKQ